MSFPVTFYEFSKKINSTLQPPAPETGAGTTWDCTLKDDCGIVSPVITVNIGLTFEPSGFNYCYIRAFRRYYKVREWTFSGGLWSAALTCDVLASYKANIGAASLYVLRSASFPDGSIIDNKYPLIAGATTVATHFDNLFTTFYGKGTYVLSVLTGGSNSGAVVYYAMSAENFKDFASQLFSDDNFNASEFAEDVSTDLWKSMFNPYQFISSCIWLPFEITEYTVPVSKIKFGWWEINVVADRIIRPIKIFNSFVTLPKHPKTAERGTYLNMHPWTSHILHCMPFGDIPIDGGKLIGSDILNIRITVDCGTGSAVLTVFGDGVGTGAERLIDTESASLGVPIPIAQVNSDVAGLAGSVIGGVGGTIANLLSGNIAGAINSAISGIGNAADSITPELTGGGLQGSVSAFADPITLYSVFYGVSEWDPEHYGRPTMKKLTISSCRGFVQVADGDVSLPATTAESEMVRSYLEAGFYYE